MSNNRGERAFRKVSAGLAILCAICLLPAVFEGWFAVGELNEQDRRVGLLLAGASGVAALRAAGDPEFELSEAGGLTGQFQGRGVKLYEILLGHWLYANEQYELAAQVLLPALDTLHTDAHLVDTARDHLGRRQCPQPDGVRAPLAGELPDVDHGLSRGGQRDCRRICDLRVGG